MIWVKVLIGTIVGPGRSFTVGQCLRLDDEEAEKLIARGLVARAERQYTIGLASTEQAFTTGGQSDGK